MIYHIFDSSHISHLFLNCIDFIKILVYISIIISFFDGCNVEKLPNSFLPIEK